MHEFNYEAVAELRSKYVPYDQVEKFVNPGEGDIILDIGAGDGFYSINFSRKVGSGGVISLEIDQRGTDIIKNKIAETGASNIKVITQDACSPIDEKGITKVFFSNSFHDLPCRDGVLDNIKAIADPKIEVILIEFKKRRKDFGPPEEIRISEEELKAIFQRHGFTFSSREELSHHYLHKYSIE